MITTTVRLPQALKVEAEALAESLGISMTALMAVALRDYLDRPVTRWSALPSPAPQPVSAAPSSPPGSSSPPVTSARRVLLPAQAFKPPRSRSDPCPCGALDPSGSFRLKFKQCHGRALASGSGASGSA